MFLIIALGFIIIVYTSIKLLKSKYVELQNKVNTSTANIILQPELHTNFEIIPSIHNWGDSLGYIYGIKNKIIYYKKFNESIIRTKDSNWDVTKPGYVLCSFRQTSSGWILMYRNITTKKILFSFRNDSFVEQATYGEYSVSPFRYDADGTIYAFDTPYIWVSGNGSADTQYKVMKMDINTGNYNYDEFPNFDAGYSFTGSIFKTSNRKIFIEDFASEKRRDYIYGSFYTSSFLSISSFFLFYDGIYIYYMPDTIYNNLPYCDYPVLRTFVPFKAVKINE